MHFTKYPHPANFAYVSAFDEPTGFATAGGKRLGVQLRSFDGGVSQIRFTCAELWAENPHLAALDEPPVSSQANVCIEDPFDLVIRNAAGQEVLRTRPGEGFGIDGQASVFQFEVPEDARFYGMGEKLFGRIELSGIRTWFWNTDVWSDFHWAQWSEHPSDPPYCSVPYVACNLGDSWVGLLLHNPGPVFMETPGRDESRVFVEWQRTSRYLTIGSKCGEPNLWVITDPTLAGLTRKLQTLVGKTPVPPLWSLGYHQSRWGYGGEADLLELDRNLERYSIPCDGLWLDLDYMKGFRIFTVDEQQFPNGVRPVADRLAKNGRRIVPILDPGVKREPGLDLYEAGVAEGMFCKNRVGKPFVGLVWPGETVFPDFTLAKVRKWWASHTADLRRLGFGAFWIDMNDPSTGPVEPDAMLFQDGAQPHELHRNQYALGMQMATVDGMRQVAPDERPFLLSRSGCAGTSRYAAVWTGDNISNENYLQSTVPTLLGMSLSGLPFCGPDIGGFGGDADDELMARWFQAGFLFPLFRNHTTADSRAEEPWSYPAGVRKLLAKYVRLRYRMLPYLYNLFIAQAAAGDPILRPLCYEFGGDEYAETWDEFMVGPSVLQAPVLEMGAASRRVCLPGEEEWMCMRTGLWRAPGTHTVRASLATTPAYFRRGAIVPLTASVPKTRRGDHADVAFLVAAPPGWKGETEYEYTVDDGLSVKGGQSKVYVRAEGDGRMLNVETRQTADGFGSVRWQVWVPRDVVTAGTDVGDISLRLTGSALRLKAVV